MKLYHDATTRNNYIHTPIIILAIIQYLAGQERFRTLTSSYYRGAQGIILVYDVSKRKSFESLNMWLQELEQFSMGGGKEVVKLLVGNKIDLNREVERKEGERWAEEKNMIFMEASAKTKEGIAQVFNEVVQKVS